MIIPGMSRGIAIGAKHPENHEEPNERSCHGGSPDPSVTGNLLPNVISDCHG
jgi:hypothetical protein